MFSSFKKKKEDDFTFNESSLPSLSETNSIKNSSGMGSSNVSPSADFSSKSDSLPTPPGSNGMGSEVNVRNSDLSNSGNDTFSPSLHQNSFAERSNGFSTDNSGFQSNSSSLRSSDSATNSNNDGISKAKLDSIDSRTALIEARLSAIEQKLEYIFQMVSHEVSDETKHKMKVDSMVNEFKRN